MVLTKFTIPRDAWERYPIRTKEYDGYDYHKLETNSWFDHFGEETLNGIKDTVKTVLRCEKINVYPNATQRAILIEWFDIYRYVYNEAIHYIRTARLEDQIRYKIDLLLDPKLKYVKSEKYRNVYNFISLRKVLKLTFNKEITVRMTKCHIPVHTIDNAIKDATKSYKSSAALHKGKKSFRIRYKKKNANQILVLEKGAFSKCKESFNKHLGVIKVSSSMKPTHDCKLSMRDGQFILFVPRDKVKKESVHEIDCCSLDPGLRTFQTVYCASGQIQEIGKNVIEKLAPLLKKLDEPIRKHKSKYKKRIRAKIKNMVDDLHWKTANTLCKFSDRILIGDMSTVSILKDKKLPPMIKRLLQTVAHFTFRMRLKAKCEEYGVKFEVVNESYTSKTCGACSELNNNLGTDKNFNCPNCRFKADRDVNGARNIMIKHLQ